MLFRSRYEIARWNGSINGAGAGARSAPAVNPCGVLEMSSSMIEHMMPDTVVGKQPPGRSPRMLEECDL